MLAYRTLTQQQYVDAVVDAISITEGHLANATDLKYGKSTIGYGYTFETQRWGIDLFAVNHS